MRYAQKILNFNLQQIAESGQCFRMNRIADRCYSVVSRNHYLEITQEPAGGQGGDLFHFSCPEGELSYWQNYFDLDTDYGAYQSAIRKNDSYLLEAAKAGSGIRILRQDPWEMIITFVISQQKTIPKIREAVEALSHAYGTRHQTFCAFPEPQQLAAASLEELKALKLGYRAKYIWQICKDCTDGKLDLPYLVTLSYQDAMEYLTGFYGIGHKVANCICLFGLHHTEAFPVDTWIQQILLNHYYCQKYAALPQSRRLPAIVKDNFSRYKGCAGVMQQYIFYYERTVLNGKQ